MPTLQCQISEAIVWRDGAYHHESSCSKLEIFIAFFLTGVCTKEGREGFHFLLIAISLPLQASGDLCCRKRTTYIFSGKYMVLWSGNSTGFQLFVIHLLSKLPCRIILRSRGNVYLKHLAFLFLF